MTAQPPTFDVGDVFPKLEIHYNGDDWAALYVDGELAVVGDSYLAEERAFELLGVTIVQDDAFMRGQTRAAGVAPTLDEVQAYRTAREQARELRAEAARLLAEAKKMDGSR